MDQTFPPKHREPQQGYILPSKNVLSSDQNSEFTRKTPKLTNPVNQLINHFHSINFESAPDVEPAILAPFWAEGDFVNFSGPPGCGKTLIAADIAIAAIHPRREGQALGGLLRFDLDRLRLGNIAILDAENNLARWSSIIRRKMTLEGLDPLEIRHGILYIRPSDIGLQNSSQWERKSELLAAALANCHVRFLIGDTLGRMWAPDDINSSAWVQRGYAPFRTACQSYGISGLMLTHTKRLANRQSPIPEGPIGTSFQEGQADGQIMITRLKTHNPSGILLTHRKSRRPFWIQQDSKVSLLFTPCLGYDPQGQWRDTWPHECPDYNSEELISNPTTKAAIEKILQEAAPEPIASRDIADQLKVSDRDVRHHLAHIRDEARAEMVGNGPNTRWRFKAPC